MLQFDGTIIVIAVSFIFFMLIMQRIFYKPMQEIRQEREKYINNNRHTAHSDLDESGNLQKDYEYKIGQARHKANGIVAEFTNKANQEKSLIIGDANGKANQELTQAREGISNDKNNATETLKPQVISLAHSISTKILGEEVSISGISPEMIDRILGR